MYSSAVMIKDPLCRSGDEHSEKLVKVAEEAARMMFTGFSVGLYGVGSKSTVIGAIHRQLLVYCAPGDAVIRIRGYDQTFPTIRAISAGLSGKASDTSRVAASRNIRNQADVLKAFEKIPKSRQVILLIDSIDAQPMRVYQDMFSKLAHYPNVHIVASVDHCKVGLLWNPPQLRRFSWCWLEANTYKDYTLETRDLVGFWDNLIQGKIEANTKSLSVVMDSLTSNHKELVKVLARMQLEGKSPDNQYVQIRTTEFLKKLTKLMIVSNSGRLKQLMQELLDHRIVLYSKEKDTGNEVYWLPFEKDILERISTGSDLVN